MWRPVHAAELSRYVWDADANQRVSLVEDSASPAISDSAYRLPIWVRARVGAV